MPDREIVVEVVYAGAERISRTLHMRVGSTVLQAVEASGLLEVLPPDAYDPERLGIFARRVTPQQVVQCGDRVELYRPLQLQPMEARRRRARKS